MAVKREMITAAGGTDIIINTRTTYGVEIQLADGGLAVEHAIVQVDVLVDLLQTFDRGVGGGDSCQHTRAAHTAPPSVDYFIRLGAGTPVGAPAGVLVGVLVGVGAGARARAVETGSQV